MFTINRLFWGQSFFVNGPSGEGQPGREQVPQETKGLLQVVNSSTFLLASVLGCTCWCICQGFEKLIPCANRVSICTKRRAAIGCVGGRWQEGGKKSRSSTALVWCPPERSKRFQGTRFRRRYGSPSGVNGVVQLAPSGETGGEYPIV